MTLTVDSGSLESGREPRDVDGATSSREGEGPERQRIRGATGYGRADVADANTQKEYGMTIAMPLVFVIVADWHDSPGCELVRAYYSHERASLDMKMMESVGPMRKLSVKSVVVDTRSDE